MPAQREIGALRGVVEGQLWRIAIEGDICITFAPPTAEAQEVAESIFATERGFSRLAESKLRARSLLERVMGR